MSKSQDKSTTVPSVPSHIGFIVDGNRRWAKEHNLPTLEGHRLGFKKVEDIAEVIFDKGIKVASFYLFSTENWQRSNEEVSYLMDLFRQNITRLSKKLKKQGVRMVWMGHSEPAPDDIIRAIEKAERDTAFGTKGTVVICFNYGGQWEIADAAAHMMQERMMQFTSAFKDMVEGRADMESLRQVMREAGVVSPDDIAAYLYAPEIPPCDLIVRTSGEHRISVFQLWRAAYSELLFLDKYFPDMELSDIDAVIAEYNSRSRRFGK